MNRDRDKQEILSSLQANSLVQDMKGFIQHGRVTTFEHCAQVADLSYRIDRFFALNSDLRVLLTGAMLHDFYLYDWHAYDNGAHRLHGFTHAAAACENAKRYFAIADQTSHVIRCHMWPLNINRLPRSREAWIVCLADKIVALRETLFQR